MSEVKALDTEGAVSQFWQTLFTHAKSGALFLYDDNGHDDFNSYFDQQWKKAGLTCLLEASNERMLPSGDEQKAHLGEYLTKFGQMPKLQAQLSYRILKKP